MVHTNYTIRVMITSMIFTWISILVQNAGGNYR